MPEEYLDELLNDLMETLKKGVTIATALERVRYHHNLTDGEVGELLDLYNNSL